VSTSLKAAIIGLLFTGVAYSQTKTPENSPVHPGTAILDAMGIYAGEPVAPIVPSPPPVTTVTRETPTSAPAKP
jgi:xanthosine utilization system XapX-like protein